MLTDEERRAAARAAWRLHKDGRFPSEAVCDCRGLPARTETGAESSESVRAWHEIAAAVGLSPTAQLHLLSTDPRAVARRLLEPLGLTPESAGLDSE